MKVFIIEDEKLGVQRLTKQLEEIDSKIEVAGVTDSIKASVTWLRENTMPDLIFMDIELADGQSFEIFKQIEIKCPVIFTTSYDEYTLQAFKVNSIDYLLKPIKKEELRQSLDKYQTVKQQYINNHSVQISDLISELKTQNQGGRNRFLIKQGQRFLSIDAKEIAYFYVDGKLTFFKTWDNRKFIVEYTLEEIARMVDEHDFYRLNRAFIAHIKAIDKVHNFFNGKLKIELTPEMDKEILVSREGASGFKEWFGQ